MRYLIPLFEFGYLVPLSLFFLSPAHAETVDLQFEPNLVLSGDEVDQQFGAALAVGDFDGDGVQDLAVGAPTASGRSGSRAAGRVYVFFGGPGPERSAGGASAPSADVVVFGGHAHLRVGFRLAAGDMDGDGRAELAIGTMEGTGPEGDRDGCGEARVIFGRPRPEFPATIDLSTREADIVVFGSESKDHLAGEMATGDIDGDGREDLLMGAFYGDGPDNGRWHAGEVSILFGGERASLPRVLDLARTSIPTVYGREIEDTFGRGIASGDVDGDGVDDLVVGSYYGDGPENSRTSCGETCILFGGPREQWPLSIDLAAERSVPVIFGERDGDVSGRSVAVADLDGDGFGDLVISAHKAAADPLKASLSYTGVAYVLFGRSRDAWGRTFDLRTDADVRLHGRGDGDAFGWPVTSGPWLGGRGAVFAPGRESDCGTLRRANAGEVFVLAGRDRSEYPRAAEVDGVALFSLVGRDEKDRLGASTRTLDWNGDGAPEIALGAPDASGPGARLRRSGKVLIYFPR